ncbi:hypothetical protein FFJ24_004495 [Pedobacter sp. KBS0701]|uniref:hypothetical protein n=1 Tax=Pedobacter sp. KBS0701 TaxID=2578106 RepID=UPI00110D47B5|nr:hypothetical protein [Pedobacter sp. KBS0701]QDW24123.1 hypothetical protein FFJ24_004495 [Pedobacter sp. KBS0701]
MSESLNIGDMVKHQFLKEGPEMYVAAINQGSVVCRYFGAGVFHSVEFTFEEVLPADKCEAVHKAQAEEQARNSRNLHNMLGGI